MQLKQCFPKSYLTLVKVKEMPTPCKLDLWNLSASTGKSSFNLWYEPYKRSNKCMNGHDGGALGDRQQFEKVRCAVKSAPFEQVTLRGRGEKTAALQNCWLWTAGWSREVLDNPTRLLWNTEFCLGFRDPSLYFSVIAEMYSFPNLVLGLVLNHLTFVRYDSRHASKHICSNGKNLQSKNLRCEFNFI